MNLRGPLVVAAALLLVAAAPVEPPSFDAGIAAAATLLDDGKPDLALARLEALAPVAELPAQRGQLDALRSFALARLGRLGEARTAIEAGIAATPSPSMLVLRQLFILRALTGDARGAADAILLITASYPKGANELPSELVTDVMRANRDDKQRIFDLDYALNAANWQPADARLGESDWIRLRLITALVARDRGDEVPAVLARVQDPAVLLRLGIDRRYAAYWPEVERRLGPGARTASVAFVDAAKAQFDAAPKSLVARLGYAQALNIAARESEAITVANVATTPAELAALSGEEIWLVNLHANLLADAGRSDEALARLGALNATPVAGRGGLINTIINQALLAEAVGRPREALAAADFADSQSRLASDFGRAYIAKARVCALTALGRKAEAEPLAAALFARSGSNSDAVLGAQICLGQSDAAAKTLIAQLASEDDRSDALFALQPFLLADRASPNRAREHAALRGLKARTDVKAAYLKAGRDLPAAVSPPR